MAQVFYYPILNATVSLSNYAMETGGNLAAIKTQLTVGTTAVSVASLPLPSGAATETTLSALNTKVPSGLTVTATRLLVDGSGVTQPISATALPLPSGASTSAAQTNGSQKAQIVNSAGTSIDAKQLGVQVASTDVGLITNAVLHGLTTAGVGSYVDVKVTPSGALSVDATGSTVAATQSGTWNITNITGTVSLPTGAATETTLSAINTKVTTTINGIKVDGSAVTQPISAAALPLPTGAATEATLSAINSKMAALGQTTMSGSMPVAIASDQSTLLTNQVGLSKANAPVYNDYTSVSVTTAAYIQLIASTTSATKKLKIFDSSGQAMIIATGAAAAEVDQIYVPPGGADFELAIAAGTRVSIKALTGTASSGYLLINLLG